jgi:hypothetical protein
VAKTKKLTVAEANRAYFLVLANTRGSLEMFPNLACPIIFILLVFNVGLSNAPTTFKGPPVISFLYDVNVVIIWTTVAISILWIFRKLTYRFQVVSSAVMAGMAVGVVYTVCLMTVPLMATSNPQGEGQFAMLFNIGGLVAVALVLGATVVHVLLLQHRLRMGHSEKRTLGNIGAVSGSNRSKMYWIILAVVVVVPNVLTQGQYLMNFTAAMALVLFACVMPSLPVEFGYLAYLKSKDRDYWEKPPRRRSKKERRRLVKKVSLWAVGIVGGLALFWALAKYLPLWLA